MKQPHPQEHTLLAFPSQFTQLDWKLVRKNHRVHFLWLHA